jgi:threonine synthase
MAFSALSHLECSRDGSHHDADVVQGTSPLGAPLLARYDIERAAAAVTPADIAARPPDLWRYHELLPVRDPAPRLVAVQAAGCAPIVDAFHAGLDESTAPGDAHTVAFGITVPKALGDFLVLDAARSTGGTAIAVTDEELLAAQQALARDEGTWVCPEGAACFAAVGQLRESGWLAGDEDVVVLNTGAGLIYPDTVTVDVPTLARDGVIP